MDSTLDETDRTDGLLDSTKSQDINLRGGGSAIEMDTLAAGRKAESPDKMPGLSADGISVRKDIDVFSVRSGEASGDGPSST